MPFGGGSSGLRVTNPEALGTFYLDETGAGQVFFTGTGTSYVLLSTGREFHVQNRNGDAGLRYNEANQALFLENMIAAAPDNIFNTSSFQLWLDDTPAATKLMIKATDSGGTVRTAAIVLL